jgi:hypothetical protein
MRIVSVVLLLLLAGCNDRRSFDPAAWKADTMTESDQHLDVRRAMVADIERRFRPGIGKAEILRNLGTPEYDASDSCDYPDADTCIGYELGASLADYDFLIFAFKADRLVHIGQHRS